MELTSFGKILEKEWEKTTALSQTSTQRRMRRGLDNFTLVSGVPLWKSKAILC